MNNQIRISPVRLIDVDGKQVGIMETVEALRLAREKSLDLVEISPTSTPPVCRIMDYGKYKYEQTKKVKNSRKKQHVVHLKEIKIRPNIEDHDFLFKIKHARNFLQNRDKVKLTIIFRGREVTHQEFGKRILNRAVEELSDVAIAEAEMRIEGRNMILILSPKS